MTIEGHLGDLWPRIFRLCCFTFDIKTNFLTHVYHMLNKSGSWHNQNTTLLNSPVLLQDYSKEGSSLVPDRTMPLEITLLFFFFFFCSLFRAVPTAYGGSQARGQIGAAAAAHATAMATPDPSCIWDLCHSLQCWILNPQTEAKDLNPHPHIHYIRFSVHWTTIATP